MKSMSQSKNIVLLGASSDIGGAILKHLINETDTNVLAVSRRALKEPRPSHFEFLSGIDLTDEAALQILSNTVKHAFTEPFSILHCVGDFWIHRPLIETTLPEVSRMLSSQITTLFGAAMALTPTMIANGGGRLLAFSCNSVVYSYPDMSPFTASKAAIESFIKCYANEHSEFGISACALALPTIRTATVLKEKPQGDHKNYVTPESLAEIIVQQVLTQSPVLNGNVIKLFQHSPSFYHSSYYDRNPRTKKAPT
jgi:NAD(P)-dependent dehydrogenase (short-subunit alcohol dehydrogenase family)